MKWTRDEENKIWGICGGVRLSEALTIASCAVELVAARGGTMTADEIAVAIKAVEADLTFDQENYVAAHARASLSGLLGHISAQGARLAAAEVELVHAQAVNLADLRRHLAQVDVLKTAGAVLSAHVDKTAVEVALDRSTVGEEIAVPDADRFAFDEGAEAVRAACLEAVCEWATREGFGPAQIQGLKAAIEGAAP